MLGLLKSLAPTLFVWKETPKGPIFLLLGAILIGSLFGSKNTLQNVVSQNALAYFTENITNATSAIISDSNVSNDEGDLQAGNLASVINSANINLIGLTENSLLSNAGPLKLSRARK